MKQKNKEYKENKIKKKQLQFQNYDKIYKNFENLEKKIKMNNIHDKLKKEKKKEIENEDEDSDINEKSNGSIGDKNLEKKYYLGCLDVKMILSKNFNTYNVNNVNNNNNFNNISKEK